MSEGQSIVACPKCGCAAWSWANPDAWGFDCMACGHWYHAEIGGEENEGGGCGVVAYHGQSVGCDCWSPLDESTQQPFTSDELAKVGWAWFSRPAGDGRWEGVAVKGEPRANWVVGIIPPYEDRQQDV